MSEARSRWKMPVLAVLIVMLQVAIPQRGGAQWRSAALPGLRFGPPLKASAAVGFGYGNSIGASPFAGPLILGDVGLGGARASAGWFVAGPFASGIEVLGSALRTWGAPSQLEKNRTLVGGEVRVSFFLVNVGGGVFRPTKQIGDERRTRYYLNVGLGI